MVWWVVGGLVLVSLLGLALVLGMLRRRLAELDRVARLARERAAAAQAGLTAAAGPVPQALAGVQARVAGLRPGRDG